MFGCFLSAFAGSGEGAQAQQVFQQLLFSKIVPNCKKLGLLDANDGWLRKKFDVLGVTQFEDWADTGEEYLEMDAVAQDRAAAAAEAAAAS